MIFGQELVSYFHDMIVEMLSWGFQEGKMLFGFGYDFRQINRLHWWEYFIHITEELCLPLMHLHQELQATQQFPFTVNWKDQTRHFFISLCLEKSISNCIWELSKDERQMLRIQLIRDSRPRKSGSSNL